MPDRREFLRFGAAAMAVALAGGRRVLASEGPNIERLETRLFNFKDDLSPEETATIVENYKTAARAAGVEGLLVGRNFNPTPYPTRFEWVAMVQRSAERANADPRFSGARARLDSACRNAVHCELAGRLPARFADAKDVKLRHTVLFNFKPDASAEARDRIVGAIRGMGTLPMVGHYLVDRNPEFNSGPDQMEWQVVGDFASAADYRAYSDAPVHLAIRDDFTAHTSRVAFIDVEV